MTTPLETLTEALKSAPPTAVIVASIAVAFLLGLLVAGGGGNSSSQKDLDSAAEVAVSGLRGGAVERSLPSSSTGEASGGTEGGGTTTPATAATTGGGGKKKKKKKSKAASAASASASAAADANGSSNGAGRVEEEAEPEQQNQQSQNQQQQQSKKKKKKKGKGGNKQQGGGNSAATASNGSKENVAPGPDQEARDAAMAAALAAELNAGATAVNPTPQPDPDDGWVVEKPKRKKKGGGGGGGAPKSKPAAASSGAAANVNANPNAAAPDSAAEAQLSVSIPSNKVGIIIGPKGATMQSIESATETKLDVRAPPKDEFIAVVGSKKNNATKATVVITGTSMDNVRRAKNAVDELVKKGYCTLTQPEGFSEHSVNVHPRFLSEIVGSGGTTIRALQDKCDVKITIPPTDWTPKTVQVGKVAHVKVGIAGSKENCLKAKTVIQSIVRYHHHEITHPGMVHEEIDVPPEFYHCVIGPRGSEMRHIRGNYQCEVYLPNEDSYSEYTVVVGRRAMVDRAVAHIGNLMDRDAESRQRKYDDSY